MRPGGRVRRGPSRRLVLEVLLLSARSASTSPASFDIGITENWQLVSFNVVPPGGMGVANVLGHLSSLDPGTSIEDPSNPPGCTQHLPRDVEEWTAATELDAAPAKSIRRDARRRDACRGRRQPTVGRN